MISDCCVIENILMLKPILSFFSRNPGLLKFNGIRRTFSSKVRFCSILFHAVHIYYAFATSIIYISILHCMLLYVFIRALQGP